MNITTLLLQGSECIEPYKQSIALLDHALPYSRVVTLPGQEHVAIASAPGLFAEEVVKFLKSDERDLLPEIIQEPLDLLYRYIILKNLCQEE